MSNSSTFTLAPELEASAWLNCSQPLSLAQLTGKVVVIHAFQMLCPGCVTHGLPQARAIYELYAGHEVQVIGLHTVFEHHQVMTVEALTAFAYEYRLRFPIAVDTPSTSGPIPLTMAKYQLQGTPSLIVIDQQGRLRLKHFGQISDLQLGSLIGGLLAATADLPTTEYRSATTDKATADHCGDDGCVR